LEPFDFRGGEVFLVDKPFGWTSFKVVNVIRKIITRNIGVKVKVGHAGTLDPLATGLLILCSGKATKTIESIQGAEKEYTGTMRIGATTPSFDLEQEIDQTFDTSDVKDEMIHEAVKELTGEIFQTPPVFSAKKIDGKRAYKHARKGVEVKMRTTIVDVREFEISGIDRVDDCIDLTFRISCSKGTYIRSLAHDLGKKLNNGAHLSALRRTRIGDFELEDAIHPDDLKTMIAERGFLPVES
jgi:tRNA pseudouridine55 synthase